MQLFDLKSIEGKTIKKTAEFDNTVAVQFTDDSFIVLEGAGDYDAGYIRIREDNIKREFAEFGDEENALLVFLGIKTQDEADKFMAKVLKKRGLAQQAKEMEKETLRKNFPFLYKIGVVD